MSENDSGERKRIWHEKRAKQENQYVLHETREKEKEEIEDSLSWFPLFGLIAWLAFAALAMEMLS